MQERMRNGSRLALGQGCRRIAGDQLNAPINELWNRCPGSGQPGTAPMKKSTDTGFIVSLHYDASPDTLRVNLTWQGDHDISAFDLDRFGQVLHYENESENTGWALIKPSCLVSPGEAIPLRKGVEILNLRNRNSSGLDLLQLSLFQR